MRKVVRDCSGLSRMELARTVCELLGWRRPNGRLKARECREFLERLDAGGALVLPDKRRGRASGSVTADGGGGTGTPAGRQRARRRAAGGGVGAGAQRLLFRELVGRYHYLGHAVPFGAHTCATWCLRRGRRARWWAACSSRARRGAWRCGYRWVGWDERTRARNLQRVVNNSRFLLLPWVGVKNLASAVLARGLRRLVVDWPRRYHLEPWLVETLVDSRRHHGGLPANRGTLWPPRRRPPLPHTAPARVQRRGQRRAASLNAPAAAAAHPGPQDRPGPVLGAAPPRRPYQSMRPRPQSRPTPPSWRRGSNPSR